MSAHRILVIMLLACLPGGASALDLVFRGASSAHDPAAQEYASIWQQHGKRIVRELEATSGVKLKEQRIEVVVHEGRSASGLGSAPMKLRASYPEPVKRGTLVHELGHRYLALLWPGSSSLTTHQQLNLLLLPVWRSLWGEEFVAQQVKVESGWSPEYSRSWEWIQSLSEQDRHRELEKLRAQ